MSEPFPPPGRAWVPPNPVRRPDRKLPVGIRDADPQLPPDDVLLDHPAPVRVLDPATAVRAPGDDAELRPTVYVANELLVPAPAWNSRLGELVREAAALYWLDAKPDETSERRARLLPQERTSFPVTVRLRPTERPAEPDAWPVLQAMQYRAAREGLAPEAAQVGLNHLVLGNLPYMSGNPTAPSPYLPGGGGLVEYGMPGRGGRMPVVYVGSQPERHAKLLTRRPVVAVIDTGCGKHPWLPVVNHPWLPDRPSPVVNCGIELDGVPAGHHYPSERVDPEYKGDLFGPLDGALDSHSGHGTFICGLIRQLCPDADLISIPIMSSTGLSHEDDLLWALAVLRERLRRTIAGDAKDGQLDVVVLSMGYYYEKPSDLSYNLQLLSVLTDLGSMGVVVVAAAGNDATVRPMYPAAFAPHAGGYVTSDGDGFVPVQSVGSLNPDNSVALFSNSGDWVNVFDAGAAVVSTFPVTFDGGGSATVETKDAVPGRERRTIDPDYFGGGFGIWSGTSFAAPILAGRLAQELLEGPVRDTGMPRLDAPGVEAAVNRTKAAVRAVTSRLPS
jgi:serine protease